MSADNWTKCPRCKAKADEAEGARQAALAKAYGKVSVEEFDALRAAPPLNVLTETFREDYEIYGADEGRVQFDYSGKCTACGLACTLQSSRVFWPEARS